MSKEQHRSDLERLIEVVNPQKSWIVLDVTVNGGTVPSQARVIASGDIIQAVISTDFAEIDSEKLSFAANSFDLVLCRCAAHHFRDTFRFMCEAGRVLKAGGTLAVHDYLLPEHARAARYIDSFERLRDPQYTRSYSESEWRGMFLDAGLSVEHSETTRHKTTKLHWAKEQGCTSYVIERLHVMLAQAPNAVSEWLKPRCLGTPGATFDHVHITITGKKQ
jgi:SAM-dependent methyltransferase